ncbi:MAG: hypothetical protein K8T91_19195 [Planctomycetes bacterium]|nr:hypothetical protein [Planctomycetota bacterium]
MKTYGVSRITVMYFFLALWSSLVVHNAHSEDAFGELKELPPAKIVVAARVRPASPLDKVVSLSFKEAKLADVLAEFQKQTGISARLDEKQDRIHRESTVTIVLPAMSAKSALRHILRSIDPELTFIWKESSLLISTYDEAQDATTSIVYDVNDLLSPPSNLGIRQLHEDQVSDRAVAAHWLTEVIAALIEPTSWDQVGGPGQIQPLGNKLVIRQMPDVHEEIEMFLGKLREARPTRDPPITEPINVRSWLPGFKHEEKIRKALQKKISLTAEKIQLRDLLNEVGQEMGSPILIDDRAFRDNGSNLLDLVTLKCHELPSATAIQSILRQTPGLACEVRDEALVVTSTEQAARVLPLYLYPVRDLVPGDIRSRIGRNKFFGQLLELIVNHVEPESWDSVGGPAIGATCTPAGVLAIRQTEAGHAKIRQLLAGLREAMPAPTVTPADRYTIAVYHLGGFGNPPVKPEQISELVKKLVQPASWKADGAIIEVVGNKLIVRQKESIQAEIEELLLELDLLATKNPQWHGCGSTVPIVG